MSTEQNPWVEYTLERGPIRGDSKAKVGLTLVVKARPELENFMQHLSEGRIVSSDAFAADGWTNLDTGKSLDVYQIDNKAANLNYSLTHVGSPLLVGNDRVGENALVNLSFLRLVGISTTEFGIRIGIPGAFSAQYVQDVRLKLPQVLGQFLKDFVVPMTINVQIISR